MALGTNAFDGCTDGHPHRARDFSGGLCFGLRRAFEALNVLVAQDSFTSDVQADHGQRDAGAKDDLGGFGIDVDVELGCR